MATMTMEIIGLWSWFVGELWSCRPSNAASRAFYSLFGEHTVKRVLWLLFHTGVDIALTPPSLQSSLVLSATLPGQLAQLKCVPPFRPLFFTVSSLLSHMCAHIYMLFEPRLYIYNRRLTVHLSLSYLA